MKSRLKVAVGLVPVLAAIVVSLLVSQKLAMASDPGNCNESPVTEGGISRIVSGGSQTPVAPDWVKQCTQYYSNQGAPYTIGALWAAPDSVPSNGSTTFYTEAYVSEHSNYYDSSGNPNKGPAINVTETVTNDTVRNSSGNIVASGMVPHIGYPLGDIPWGQSRGNGAAFNLTSLGLSPGTYTDCVEFTQAASYYDSTGSLNRQSASSSYCFGITVTAPTGTPTLDGALTTISCSTIGGWSAYTDGSATGTSSNPGRIDILVGGPAGGGGQGWKSINANQSNGDGHDGRDFSTSPTGGNFNLIDGAPHTIYAYQFDNSGNPRQLPGSGATLQCSVVTPPPPPPQPGPPPPPPPPPSSPTGAILNANCTQVTGWAEDPGQDPNAIAVYLTFNTPYNSSASYGSNPPYVILLANQSLGDGHDGHDFAYTIPNSLKTGSDITVYANVKDTSGRVYDLDNSPADVGSCQPLRWNLLPSISGTDTVNGNGGGSFSAPSPTGRGHYINLTAYVYNSGNTSSPNYVFRGYNPNGGPPVSETGDLTQQSGTGLGPNSTSPPFTYGYTVPASATDGQKICFGGDVRPGQGDGDGNILSPQNVWDPFSGSNGPCFEIVVERSPYLTTQFGDVHASGGIGVGVACSAGVTNGQIQGSNQQALNVSYVASAGGSITNSSAGQFLGNDGSVGNGNYGQVCRPDLVSIAERIVGDPSYSGIIHYNCSPTAADILSIGHNQDGIIYCPPGGAGPTVVLPAVSGIVGRVTFYAPGHNVIIGGDVRFDPSVQSIDNLPGFGVVTDKDIYVQNNVARMDGYYFAEGNVNTCTDGGGNAYMPSTPSACQQVLSLYGLMMAHSYRFDRSGPVNTDGPVLGELFSFIGDIYLAPPPVFRDVVSQRADRPRYAGELPPLY